MKPVFLFLSILIFTSCNGQKTTSTIDGIPNGQSPVIATGDTVSATHDSILIVLQAANDEYWFGSNGHGVYRYDGKILLHYTSKHGLSNDTVREIQEDSSGNIFFTTHNGISKFDGVKFSTLTVDKTKASVWKLGPGDLWFKGEPGKNGPYRYDGKNLYHLEFPKHYMEDLVPSDIPHQRYSPYEVYFIYKADNKSIWFGTSNFGICRYDGKTFSWMYEDQLQFTRNGGSFGIRSIREDKDGKFWICNTRYRYTMYPNDSIGQTHRFIRYKKEKGMDLKMPDGDNAVYCMSILKDDTGDLWMATFNSGVWRYDGKTMIHYPVKKGDADITLYAIYRDNKGNLWLGTHTDGAYKFNGKTFEKFRF